MRLMHVAALVLAGLMAPSCRMITEAMPDSAGGLTPTPNPKPTATPNTGATPTQRPRATPTSTPEPTATPTPVVSATQSPETSCPASAPPVKLVNGSNQCKLYVPTAGGNCGVDSTWWHECSDFYFEGAVYQYIGGGNPWLFVGHDTGAPCFVATHNYQVGDLVAICSKGGATSCDPDHEVNPGMIACCRNHYWAGDNRRVVVTAIDASGTPLTVKRNAGGNPSFSEIVIAHPGEQLTVTYCLPPPPLADAECGTVFPYQDDGCTIKVFTP
jgi:hypothetical protein